MKAIVIVKGKYFCCFTKCISRDEILSLKEFVVDTGSNRGFESGTVGKRRNG